MTLRPCFQPASLTPHTAPLHNKEKETDTKFKKKNLKKDTKRETVDVFCCKDKRKTKTELSQKYQKSSDLMRSTIKMVRFRMSHSKVAFCLCFAWCPTLLPSLLRSGCKMVLCFCRMYLASGTAHSFPP